MSELTFKNCPPFTDCIRVIDNVQVDKSRNLDILILMYNLIEIKDCNIMIDGRNFFDLPMGTCGNIRKIATSQGDDYTTDCLIDYQYFKKISS